MKKKSFISISVILVILIIDQILKIWVKTNMVLGEQIPLLGNWFKLHFVENEGMAFGIVFFGGYTGKLLLTLFRILASGAIIWIIYKMIKSYVSTGLLISISVICAGAIGNIIDCVFYGKIFSLSTYYPPPADIFPASGGYAPFMQGKVVDMLQLDLFTIGNFNFFPAIFNIADASITVGLFVLILFYYKPLSAFVASFEKEKSKQ
ncbi:MAG TPA: signal peptidase II [Bacteroidales bacterium]|nr:lipoprotein signal peptidase [Bacteroidales bacterium]HOF16294.1 signal peptidase II [Bacteroidales bacterium]HON20327.1 signal peptidase II [Bacteroidales bacterium]HOR82610.1 signal peptidase II [Bacteroidales bacterium]HPJ91767.1 signal peptidase II [Bacteroidales bacterium]